MGKAGRKNRRYSTEFKICVIMDIREHRLGYHETVRRYRNTKTHSEECNYINVVKRRERIFSEEGAEGLMKERRGKNNTGGKHGRPPKLDRKFRKLKKFTKKLHTFFN